MVKRYKKLCALFLISFFILSFSGTAKAETGDVGTRIGNSDLPLPSTLPRWWPKDLENFTFFSDESAPRLVDDADIFTPEEEEKIVLAIEKAVENTDKDFVVYTDVTDYGMGRDICAADFYDFSGYGRGEKREGICLFLNMDPDKRGGWTVCTGPDMISLYTESIANDMDDVLYYYLKEGEYSKAILSWLWMGETLCLKGIPFAPDWYPDRGADASDIHLIPASFVTDEKGVLGESELEELTNRAKDVSDTLSYNTYILYGDPGYYGLTAEEYLEKFYQYHSFREEEKETLLLGIFPDEEKKALLIWNESEGIPNLTSVNKARIEKKVAGVLEESSVAAGEQYLSDVIHMDRTGRVTKSFGSWAVGFLLSLLGASVFSGISLSRASKLADKGTAKGAEEARAYLVPGTVYANIISKTFLSKTERTRYVPKEDDRGSGSSGRSTYKSSYSGHSGSTHSGSGRSF